MDLDLDYPSLADLARRAERRVPRFVWEYLDSATGDEAGKRRATEALDGITMIPRVPRKVVPELTTRLLGREWSLPVGIAPVGMSGLIWPGAEVALARAAIRAGAPYGLSTVAAATPEAVGPATGGHGWFQLYAPGDPKIRKDLLARARGAGFETLVLTVDVPAASRRERQLRSRLSNPMRLSPRIVLQAAAKPSWAVATLREGRPSLVTLAPYAETGRAHGATQHAGYQLRTAPDLSYIDAVRAEWDGPLVVKGVLHPEDAAEIAMRADAVWVSAHGGRQFEAAPAPATQLPAIRATVGPRYPLIADGGVRSGTDVLRLIARGADFVMLGRAFHNGMAAFGPRGIDHVFNILRAGLIADLHQLGRARPAEMRDTACDGGAATQREA